MIRPFKVLSGHREGGPLSGRLQLRRSALQLANRQRMPGLLGSWRGVKLHRASGVPKLAPTARSITIELGMYRLPLLPAKEGPCSAAVVHRVFLLPVPKFPGVFGRTIKPHRMRGRS